MSVQPSTTGNVKVILACSGLFLSVALFVGGCDSSPEPKLRAREAPTVVRDTPSVFRQTLGSQATIRGTEQILVSGFGLVVGLNGTGGGPLPVQIQSTMERELARGGVGKGGPLESGPLAGKTPRQVLADPSVAVVVVEGVISPGSPMGSSFDVRVRTLPGSSVTSLEGGQLWTTEMRLGNATPFGAMRAHKIGEARGPIFINPFAESAGAKRIEDDGITRTVGRVIGGGRVTDPLAMEVVLDNPSHARAASLVAAINSRFPAGPSDDGQCARGRNDQSIVIRVPREFRDRSADFVRLLNYVPIESAFANEYAKRYVEELRATPAMAEDLSWALVAVGKPAIPFVQGLYESAELLPRMAALRAGALLGDMRAVPALQAVASGKDVGTDAQAFRSEAIVLLGRMGFNPSIDSALRELVGSANLETRIAAYEALSERNDPAIRRVSIDNRFSIDSVPFGDELIYITQQGAPRIVIFGKDVKLRTPSIVSAWDERFMLVSEGAPKAAGAAQSNTGSGVVPTKFDPSRPVRLYYRSEREGSVTRSEVSDRVIELVRYLATKPSADGYEMGLGLTYSQIVGVLYQMQKQNAVTAAFTTEENRLLAALASAENEISLTERPENESKRDMTKSKVIVLRPGAKSASESGGDQGPLVVPIERAPTEGEKKDAPAKP